MTASVICDDHECRFNDYHVVGSLRENGCQFSWIKIKDGECQKREVVKKP
jgi:hypothetical protein